MDTVGNFLQNYGGTIGSMVGTGAQLYGQQNAGEAISKAATAGIGTANTTMGNINALYNPQYQLGVGADKALGSALGVNGQPADYSNFMNMPGYQFAVQQGTQAAERQAAAMGNAGNSGTSAMIGNQVAGTAMQDYNNYINQLYQAAGLGQQANSALTGANLQTAGNVEQLGMNAGMAQAGMYTGMGQTASGVYGVPGAGGGLGGAGGAGGLAGMIGSGLKMLGGFMNGSGGGTAPTPYTMTPDGNGGYTSNDPYQAGTSYQDIGGGMYAGYGGNNGGLVGTIDPSTGVFIADVNASLGGGGD